MHDKEVQLKNHYKEISKEQAIKLESGTVFTIYNPLTDSIKEEIASKRDIAHNKFCYDKLRFFIKKEGVSDAKN